MDSLKKIIALCLSGIIMLTSNLPIYAAELQIEPRATICSSCMQGYLFERVEVIQDWKHNYIERDCVHGHWNEVDLLCTRISGTKLTCNSCGAYSWVGSVIEEQEWICWYGRL